MTIKTSPGNPTLPLLVVAMMAFTSCTSTSRTRTAKRDKSPSQRGSVTTPLTSSDWYLVSKQPPTYYPKGVSADAPTSYYHGEWVYGGENGERWFIPAKGLDQRKRQQLGKDALAMQTFRQRNEDTIENSLELTAEAVVYTAVAMAFAMGQAGGGTGGYCP